MMQCDFSDVGEALRKCLFIGMVMLLLASAHAPLWAKDDQILAAQDLSEMSIEDLMNMEITSAGKKAQKLSEAAAAVFVITQEDIRRSGATSIPEMLRMVPGLEVARNDADIWAVSSRGFNGRLANKLLVLMDGRSVYTPLYSGVFWDLQDTVLDDVERIEVIRGPGATLWGANAVNGVINIITKHARDTTGGLASVTAGSEEREGAFRLGGKIGAATYFRMYAKNFKRDSGIDEDGQDTYDAWDHLRSGFRIDSGQGDDQLTVQGDAYTGEEGQTVVIPNLMPPYAQTFNETITARGGNLITRWRRIISTTSELSLQFYYDRTELFTTLLNDRRNTYDLDLQHSFSLGERQGIIWGLGYRRTSDNITNSFGASFDPEKRRDTLTSAFVQDDITLVKDRLRLTLGTKFEHNDYTGRELQPNGRILWTPKENHSVWAAVSRAVRTPSRAEHDAFLVSQVLPPGYIQAYPLPVVIAMQGDDSFDSEELNAYELGYRFQPLEQLAVDIATFYNDYDKLRTITTGDPYLVTGLMPYVVVPVLAGNDMKGHTYGAEVAVDWRVMDWWKLQGAFTYTQMRLDEPDDATTTSPGLSNGETPHQQYSLRSTLNPHRDVDFDLWVRHVSRLPDQDVKAYTTLDVRFAYRPVAGIEISLVGQNLLSRSHEEFSPEIVDTMPSEVERSAYGKLTWKF